MPNLTAKWRSIHESDILRRSSQIVSVANNQVYIFGGELRPREPRDNDIHILSLENGTAHLTTIPSTAQSPSPSPRVGSASTTVNNQIYLFSGRGGVAMAPIEEQGSLWMLDAASAKWTLIAPTDSSPIPASRSYHCMASDGNDTLYLHAGCPEKGRLSDLWAFNLSSKEWAQLASAPDPARGGTSIAFAEGLLYRMNGFDGVTEQGGSVDIYDPQTDSWTVISYTPDGVSGPTPRSVGALLPVTIDGRNYLVTFFGERDPSSLGHQGAGKMLGDVWAFDLGGKVWVKVDGQADAEGQYPAARGWFDAGVIGKHRFIVQGGLGESNERLGDVWSLDFS